LFRVGELSHRLEREPNNGFDQAETVSPPLTLNGRLEAADDFDVFRFQVEEGSTWIFDLRGSRNGNGVDTTLLLFDQQQRKLAHSEDYFLTDPLIAHTFGRGGWHYAVVQSKGNSPTFAYQLDIRRSAHLETISPLSFAPGREAEITLFGEALLDPSARLWFSASGFRGELLEAAGRSAKALLSVPGNAAPGRHRLALVTAEGRSDPVDFQVDPTPEHAGGRCIAPPVSITGVATFPHPERFLFEAQAGQTLVFEVRAQQLGAPVDSILRVLDREGRVLAMNDDAESLTDPFNHDSRIVHTFAEAGAYELEMRNLVHVTGANYPYQLVVRPPEPAVDLILSSPQAFIYPNGTRRFSLTIDRREGFERSLLLNVRSFPEGIEAEPLEVPPGQKEAGLELKAGSLPPGSRFSLQVSAGPEVSAWQQTSVGTTPVTVRELLLTVAEKPRFAIEAGLKSFSLVRGGSVKVPVRVERTAGFTAPLRLWLDNLPDGLRSRPVEAPAGSDGVELTLEAAAEARPATLTQIVLLAASDDGETNEAPRVPFTVD
jgi:hypothetical protein